ncbi:recombinase family protein [uncultured Microbacterium sp.]|uniref:recombinase family protein n=1 Tax=uncultured Microbacterium sp. TaxID=191216 RepID=UPI0037DCA192
MHTAADIDADGNSIATQRELCAKRCKRLKAPIAETFVEPGNSAQSIAKRPVFRELLSYVEEHPEVGYVVIYMRSRIFRNQADAAITKRILAGMGVKLISAKEEFGDGYMADAMEAITDIMNEVQVRQSGEDIKNKLLHKAKNGGTVGRAKLGYLNVRKDFDGRLVNTIDVDPVRAPLIQWAFEQYATGEYSTIRLADALADQGLTTRKSAKWPERPLSRSQLSLILRDPYYLGMVTFKESVYPGRHPAIISPELFERVQQVMNARLKRGQRDRVHSHFLRGLMMCGQCHEAGREHRLIFAQARNSKGDLFDYYLCRGRQDGVCELPYLRVADVERAVASHFGAAAVPAEAAKDAQTGLENALGHLLARQQDQRARLAKELKTLDTREERLIDIAADGGIASDKLRARLRELQVKKNEVRSQMDTTDELLRSRTESAMIYLDLMTKPDGLFLSANDSVRRLLLTAFFSRIWILDDGHQVTAVAEYQPLVSQLRDAVLTTSNNKKSAGEISDASAAEPLTQYLEVICSSKTNLVAGAGLEPATSRL